MNTAIALAVAMAGTGIAGYLTGRNRAVRNTLAWKRGHALGHRAGHRQGLAAGRQERNRIRTELAELKATGRDLITAIQGSAR